MKTAKVTNTLSGCKYTIKFNLKGEEMKATIYDEYDDITANRYSKENETVDDFIKRVKTEIKSDEDL